MGEACSKVSPSQFNKTAPVLRSQGTKGSGDGTDEKSSGSSLAFGLTGDMDDADKTAKRAAANTAKQNPGQNGPLNERIPSKSRFGITGMQPADEEGAPSSMQQNDDFGKRSDTGKLRHLSSEDLKGNLRTFSKPAATGGQGLQLLAFSRVRNGDSEWVDKAATSQPIKRRRASIIGKQPAAFDEQSPRSGVQKLGLGERIHTTTAEGDEDSKSKGIRPTPSPFTPSIPQSVLGANSRSSLRPNNGGVLQLVNSPNNSVLGPPKLDSATQMDETPRKLFQDEASMSRISNTNDQKFPDKRLHRVSRPDIHIVEDASMTSVDGERAIDISPVEMTSNPKKLGSSSSKRNIAISNNGDKRGQAKTPASSARKQVGARTNTSLTQESMATRTGTTDPEAISAKTPKGTLSSVQQSKVAPSSLQLSAVSNLQQKRPEPLRNLHGSDQVEQSLLRVGGEVEYSRNFETGGNLGASRYIKQLPTDSTHKRDDRIHVIVEEKSFVYQSVESLDDFCEELEPRSQPQVVNQIEKPPKKR